MTNRRWTRSALLPFCEPSLRGMWERPAGSHALESSSTASGGSMTSPSASSNRLPHSGHRIGSDPARPSGRPTALRLMPSYGHTTKFTHRRIRRTVGMRSLPWRNSARRAAEADIAAERHGRSYQPRRSGQALCCGMRGIASGHGIVARQPSGEGTEPGVPGNLPVRCAGLTELADAPD